MKLKQIDKNRYRKHLNITIIVAIIALTSLSLGISQSAIWLFTDREGTHFWLNISGVAIAMMIIGSVLNKAKEHEFMTEVYYVWRLKQQINYIHRKHQNIEKAVNNDNVTAITIMSFYFAGCQQLYQLDDNTITLSTLNKKADELDEKIDSLNLSIDINNYNQQMLSEF
ncbi:MAG: DUF3087 domain-containing protein [Gammaproteobacteria bacterium]|nr:DUF3087 domain-containing protein [Gammaproteobacteria bacterium]